MVGVPDAYDVEPNRISEYPGLRSGPQLTVSVGYRNPVHSRLRSVDTTHDDCHGIVRRLELRTDCPGVGRTAKSFFECRCSVSGRGPLQQPLWHMYETILIPTDGSECAARAIAHGLDVAQRYDATVHVLSVIDTAELLELGYVGDRSDFESRIEPLEAQAKRAVREVDSNPRREGLDVVTVVREGAPVETIAKYVDDTDVDLIVMGTHGRHGVERYLLGSVTERVLRTVDVPVLGVGPSDGEG